MHIIVIRNKYGKLLFMGDRMVVSRALKDKILNLESSNIGVFDYKLSYIEIKKNQYKFYNSCIDAISSNINKDVGDCNLFSLDLEYGSISCQHVNIQKRVIK